MAENTTTDTQALEALEQQVERDIQRYQKNAIIAAKVVRDTMDDFIRRLEDGEVPGINFMELNTVFKECGRYQAILEVKRELRNHRRTQG